MKNLITCIISVLILYITLNSCKSNSNLLVSSKYLNSCFYTDAPASVLYIKKSNRFILRSIPSYEKHMGKWTVKDDTLFLNSEYKSSLENEKDSTAFNEKYTYIIKNDKLINPNNEKCFLKRQK
ncbi:hypothetical protein [Chryseobacterium luteum]|uniref:hypothetical protein n=1 Tax=Chryseobacterium luteum TaxID=421531 RepID=UPI00104074A9|nr:hypothetical protein [Chryseobacterium luteum]